MGGSSLAPEVFQKAFGNAPGFPELLVLDSTHPAAILAAENTLDLSQTLICVSSKSGTTLETISLFRYFWDQVSDIHEKPGHRFAAITDAGSPLENLAKEKKFRRIFFSSQDVGGRYAAFTEFGLVPAALIGLDIQNLLDKARGASENSRSQGAEKKSPGFILGAALGELARHRDKLTIWTAASLGSFPAWIEQLLAESTGKQGKGIVPIVDEPFAPPGTYGQERAFIGLLSEEDRSPELEKHLSELEAYGHPTIRIDLEEMSDLGKEVFHWELATASAGAVLGIHPFNQPDVQLTKDLTRSAMETGKQTMAEATDFSGRVSIREEKVCATAIQDMLSKTSHGDYIAVHAFLPPTPEVVQALQSLRDRYFQHSRIPTTLGFGPRFLHSTGQLHKGGPNSVVAIQVVDDPEQDMPVPGTGYTFAALIKAQAMGDFRALQQKGRRVLQINLGQNVCAGLEKLEAFFFGRQ
jgi:transaldolase/glucose-6-phosphate isomerase